MKTPQERIDKIIRVIEALGLTQRQLEDATGLSYATIWRLMNGKGTPRKTTLFLLERGLGIDK